MYKSIVVFANTPAAAAELLAQARSLSGEVVLVTSNGILSAADEIYRIPETDSLCSYMPAIAKLISDLDAGLVLCEAGADGKLFAGFAAAALRTGPVCDICGADFYPEYVETRRLVYGGTAVMAEKALIPAVIVAASGLFEASQLNGVGKSVSLEASASQDICLRELSDSSEAGTVNLGAAKKVVGVGRGLCSADNLPALEALAKALGAEIGCTRPVAEEEHWFTKDRYIGVSGCKLKPSVYLAIGISGQVQHMVGINQAGTIFAINKDEQAPIFAQADYCLQGDINTLLPKLIEYLA